MRDKYARREPCGNCPFLRSAPLAHWDLSEYLKLADIEATEGGAGARSFGCHKDTRLPESQRGACVGWLLNQRRGGVRSLALRVRLMTEPKLLAQYEEASGEEACYESIGELVRANLAADRERNPERYRQAKS